MAKQAIISTVFSGGWATDARLGVRNSQAYTQALDFRKNPSQLSVLPAPLREDAGICRDLVITEVMAANGLIYAAGSQGYLYQRTLSGVWSIIGKMSAGSAGLDYRKDTDSVYATADRSVSLITPITNASSTNPTVFMPDKYAASYSTYDNSSIMGFNVNAYQASSSQTTSIKVATTPLDETAGNVRYFQTDIEPLVKVSFFIPTKGTGDWTATLHDGLNKVLATATITNANIKANDWNDFVFSSALNGQVRAYPAPNARTYHAHLTSTVANGTVSSSTLNDLTSCDLKVWADRLIITNNGLHPIDRFLQYECIGNSNYLSVWEPISDPPTNDEWKRHKLVFPEEYEVCGLTVQNEFLVIAAEKNTTLASSVPQAGILFFWDGLSETYNYFIEVPEGSPQAIHTYKNIAYYYAGGDWYGISSANSTPVKVRRLPGSDTEFSGASSNPIRLYPNAATVRRGIQLMAYPCSSTSTVIPFGVYSWGSVDKNFPDTFGYNYVISTGSQNYSGGNQLQLGMVKAFGDLLHISWYDAQNGGYGIDVVNNASKPAPYAKWQGLIDDGGYAGKVKTACWIEAYYQLPAGATIRLGYSINGNSFVTDDNAYSTTNLWQGQSNYCRFNIDSGARFREIQPQFELTCDGTVTTPPTVQLIAVVYDDNREEVLA